MRIPVTQKFFDRMRRLENRLTRARGSYAVSRFAIEHKLLWFITDRIIPYGTWKIIRKNPSREIY